MADLHYEGSLTISKELMEAADIMVHEHIHVWNVTQGTRFETYAIEGPSDSGVIQVNGAAAHLASPGDLLIITTFCALSAEEIASHDPLVVFVDSENNKITKIARHSGHVGGPLPV